MTTLKFNYLLKKIFQFDNHVTLTNSAKLAKCERVLHELSALETCKPRDQYLQKAGQPKTGSLLLLSLNACEVLAQRHPLKSCTFEPEGPSST